MSGSNPTKSHFKYFTRTDYRIGVPVRRRVSTVNPTTRPHPVGVVAGPPVEEKPGVWYIPVRFGNRIERVHVARLERLDV